MTPHARHNTCNETSIIMREQATLQSTNATPSLAPLPPALLNHPSPSIPPLTATTVSSSTTTATTISSSRSTSSSISTFSSAFNTKRFPSFLGWATEGNVAGERKKAEDAADDYDDLPVFESHIGKAD